MFSVERRTIFLKEELFFWVNGHLRANQSILYILWAHIYLALWLFNGISYGIIV